MKSMGNIMQRKQLWFINQPRYTLLWHNNTDIDIKYTRIYSKSQKPFLSQENSITVCISTTSHSRTFFYRFLQCFNVINYLYCDILCFLYSLLQLNNKSDQIQQSQHFTIQHSPPEIWIIMFRRIFWCISAFCGKNYELWIFEDGNFF